MAVFGTAGGVLTATSGVRMSRLSAAEMARVLRRGRLAALWNVDDGSHEFTAAFQREKDGTVRPPGGATGRSDPEPATPFTGRPEFTDPVLQSVRWRREMTPEHLHGLLDTMSYVIAAAPDSRAAAHDGVSRLVAGWEGPMELAEICQCLGGAAAMTSTHHQQPIRAESDWRAAAAVHAARVDDLTVRPCSSGNHYDAGLEEHWNGGGWNSVGYGRNTAYRRADDPANPP